MKQFYYDEVDSTMEEAKRLVSSGLINETSYVVASSQTSGRGTRGRVWSSPKDGGIYLSLIHLPEKNKVFEATTLYTQASGISCIEALKEYLGIETKIKPINDIYYEGKKLGGILVESRMNKEGMSLIITGIGLNVKRFEHKLDRDIIEPVSLEEILTKERFNGFSKQEFIETLVAKICKWYEVLFTGETHLVQETWTLHSLHK